MTKRMIVAPESQKNKSILLGEVEQTSTEPASHLRRVERFESKHQLLYPLEKIVRNLSGVVLKVKFPGADEAYPDVTQALFRFVTKYYPNAEGGPLYVDEPINEKEIYRAYERHKVMSKLKLRHLIVEKDSTYEHLLEQLGKPL